MNRTITRQIAQATVATVTLVAIATAVAWLGIARLERAADELADARVLQHAIDGVLVDVVDMRRIVLAHLGDDRDGRALLATELAGVDAGADEALRVLDGSSWEDDGAVDAIRASLAGYREVRDRVLASSTAGDAEAARALSSTEGQAAFARLRGDVRAAVVVLDEATVAALATSRSEFGSLRLLLVGGILLAGLLGAVVTAAIARRIGSRLETLGLAAARLADGDLGARAGLDAPDETGRLAHAFDDMAERIAELVEEERSRARSVRAALADLRGHAEAVAGGDLDARLGEAGVEDFAPTWRAVDDMTIALQQLDGRVARATADVSDTAAEILSISAQNTAAAQQQATSVAEIAATVDELRATAEEASRRAQSMDAEAEGAAAQGRDGAAAVAALVEQMTGISAQVAALATDILGLSEGMQRASEVTGLVAQFADRSNLLALNAGIEAAKAGEHGRGFAVVANEVRTLAEQSKEAAQDIRGMLAEVTQATDAAVMSTEQSTKAIEAGLARAHTAGRAIQDLASVVDRSAGSAQVIAGAAREQSIGLDQIAIAMKEIEDATSQVVGGARQAEHAMRQLDALTSALQGDLAEVG